MFENVDQVPPDSIFGLIERFKKDPREEKINLSIGVYQNEAGKTPVMRAVRAAEQILLEAGGPKSYLPIDGLGPYNDLVNQLILGDELGGRSDVHSVTAQTPGGTAALRVSGELLWHTFDIRQIWISDPTWANHTQIYSRVGLEICKYDYLDDSGTGLDFERMMSSLQKAAHGSAILLHAVCHNPTGVDLTDDGWNDVMALVNEKQMLPIFDFAYQGFGRDVQSDAAPIRRFCGAGGEALICNSFSKNFGLYGERVGGITAVATSDTSAKAMQSQIKSMIRTMYSNPPLHGAQIVSTVLGDATLRKDWEDELGEMRERIIKLRSDFVTRIDRLTPNRDFDYVNRQRGMFSYSGLTGEQVERLRENHAIYALGTGRINIAGLNATNIDRVCQAIALTL